MSRVPDRRFGFEVERSFLARYGPSLRCPDWLYFFLRQGDPHEVIWHILGASGEKEIEEVPGRLGGDGLKRWKVSLDERTKALLLKQFLDFRAKFGREPTPNDPIFFDPDSSEPRPVPDSVSVAARAELAAALEDIGAPPAVLYAFRKTHQLVTEETESQLTASERQEWTDAIKEYERRIGDESDAIELCLSPPTRSREPAPSPEELLVANKLCLMTLVAYQKAISSISLEGTFFNAWLALVSMRFRIAPGSREIFRTCLGADMKEIRHVLDRLEESLEFPAGDAEAHRRIALIEEVRSLPGTWLGRSPDLPETVEREIALAFESLQSVLEECRKDGISIEATERMLLRYWIRIFTINYGVCESYFQKLDHYWDRVTASVDSYMMQYAKPLLSTE